LLRCGGGGCFPGLLLGFELPRLLGPEALLLLLLFFQLRLQRGVGLVVCPAGFGLARHRTG
jgi:hypothetical protein